VLCTHSKLLSEKALLMSRGKTRSDALRTDKNAKEKDGHKAREKHQRKFSEIFNALGEAIKALVLNTPIPHHQSQRKLCLWALPDALRCNTSGLCLGKRRC